MADNNLQGLLGVTMEKIKEMVDVNTVIGETITTPDGTILIPVSRISYGFASGGSNLPSKSPAEPFAGGSGAGINITPIAFITICNGNVQVLPIVSKPDTGDKMVNLVPEMFDKITSLFNKKKDSSGKAEGNCNKEAPSAAAAETTENS